MATDPRSDLVARMGMSSRRIIDAELRRLARRVPSLRPADLTVVDEALEEVAESLILAPLRHARQETVPMLRVVLDAQRGDRDS
jgi:hypothetical protein